MKISDITKKYKDNTVLDHLNFSFDSSHIVGLIGKNGVGKTTIMKIMNGNGKRPVRKIMSLRFWVAGLIQEW